MPRPSPLVRNLLVIAGLLAAWQAADLGRRAFIRRFFIDGALAGSDPDWTTPADAAPLAAARRVRVVLLDGLSRAHADSLPRLADICSKGQVLALDVGFPTVSLPVQHALWTGLTQQQSGVQYHIGKLATPPPHALPARVDSVAVAESHPEIVHSFGFTAVAPASADKPDAAWADAFPDAALAAVAGEARLAFVHVLRIDEAGHAAGGASPEYAAAAAWADDLLARLWSAAPADPATRWFILADHGHRPAGGHGGAEPDIRVVRACVVGGLPPAPERAIHLVDLARALADSLGVPLDPAARGRPWSAALADPAPDATLPHPRPLRVLVAVLLLTAGLFAALRLADVRADRGPRGLAAALGLAWPLLGWFGLGLLHGWPSLSNPVVYPPQGRDMLLAAAPAALVLAGLAALAVRRGWSLPRIAGLALTPWLACTLAVLVLVGLHASLAGGPPPLAPHATATASVLLAQGRLACLVLAGTFALHLLVRATIRRPPVASGT
jgi:hypothetical protein